MICSKNEWVESDINGQHPNMLCSEWKNTAVTFIENMACVELL